MARPVISQEKFGTKDEDWETLISNAKFMFFATNFQLGEERYVGKKLDNDMFAFMQVEEAWFPVVVTDIDKDARTFNAVVLSVDEDLGGLVQYDNISNNLAALYNFGDFTRDFDEEIAEWFAENELYDMIDNPDIDGLEKKEWPQIMLSDGRFEQNLICYEEGEKVYYGRKQN